MRRSLLAAAALGAPLLLSLVLVGCGKPKDEADTTSTDNNASNTGGPADKGELKALPAKHGAVLKGKVTLKGAKPDLAALTQQLQDAIKQKPDQMAACFDIPASDEAQKMQQQWVIDDQGGVGNVVVWIQPPSGSYFAIDPSDKTWKDTVELNQPHCAFIPHVAWAVPAVVDPKDPKKTVPTGQKFTVSNTAPVSHNTKWVNEGGTTNEGQLGTIPAHTEPQPVELKGNNTLVHFSCNIHGWMDAYVWVFNHPYAAVTDEHGHYEIKNVPAGSKVKIVAWHEKGPYSRYLTNSKSKGDDIELKDGETEHNFELEVK